MEVGVSFFHIWISRSSFLENVSLVCLGFHNRKPGNSMAAQWWRLSAPTAGGMCSIPGQGSQILQTAWTNEQKENQTGWLKQQTLSHSSEIQKFIIKVATWVVYGEAFVPGWWVAAFTLSPHTVLQLCMFKERSFPLLTRSPDLLD